MKSQLPVGNSHKALSETHEKVKCSKLFYWNRAKREEK